MKLLVILALVGVSFAAALPTAPEQVTDTEEVAKAKADFQVLYDAAAAKAAAGEVPEVVLPEGAPQPVADTEEVTAAKANFQAAFDAAAAAAEAAPDFDLDGALSTHTGYLSGVDGRLSPFYTNTYPYGAFGIHAPAVVAGAPLVVGGLPAVTGTPLLKSTVGSGTPLISGSPIISGSPLPYYNTLGLGLPAYGFPYGLHSPFVQVVAKEE